jgi:hypothetical protein
MVAEVDVYSPKTFGFQCIYDITEQISGGAIIYDTENFTFFDRRTEDI